MASGSLRMGAAAVVLVVMATAAGFAQAPAQAPAPPPRGLFGDLNKLFEAPAPMWSLPPPKSPAAAIEEFNARARDAGNSLSRLGSGTVATGRAVCPVAANGAPDCQVAAEQLCRDKGFNEGKSMDVEAAEVCSARAVLSRRTHEPGACRMENYVTRAMCR